MIDEALLRPGRLEVQMEISLPDEGGRVQILNIHISQIKENDKLGELYLSMRESHCIHLYLSIVIC